MNSVNTSVWGTNVTISLDPLEKEGNLQLGHMAFDVLYTGDKVVRFLRPLSIDFDDIVNELSAPHVRNEWERALRLSLAPSNTLGNLFPDTKNITDIVPVRLNVTKVLGRAGWKICDKELNLELLKPLVEN